ncbi:hypothetical protein HGRIS_014952 [Hohenbuehelia grisea]|uniref:Uncharacterized protein n=1 Tax=Hohenbuehelia grisea TaxID=104357 RepID=A0ABR3J4L6_9AGAR
MKPTLFSSNPMATFPQRNSTFNELGISNLRNNCFRADGHSGNDHSQTPLFVHLDRVRDEKVFGLSYVFHDPSTMRQAPPDKTLPISLSSILPKRGHYRRLRGPSHTLCG